MVSATPHRTLVLLRTVPGGFCARVLAARLASEGIPTHLRGNLGGPYPFGEATVWVDSEDAERASDLLLADEVEAAFGWAATPAGGRDDLDGEELDLDGDGLAPFTRRPTSVRRRLLAASGLLLLVGSAIGGTILSAH